jgi:hypothetical protein
MIRKRRNHNIEAIHSLQNREYLECFNTFIINLKINLNA